MEQEQKVLLQITEVRDEIKAVEIELHEMLQQFQEELNAILEKLDIEKLKN